LVHNFIKKKEAPMKVKINVPEAVEMFKQIQEQARKNL